MTKGEKIRIWFLAVIVHSIAAIALGCVLFAIGESSPPALAGSVLLLQIPLFIIAPFLYALPFLDRFILVRQAGLWPDAISIVFSAMVWWALVAWLAEKGHIKLKYWNKSPNQAL